MLFKLAILLHSSMALECSTIDDCEISVYGLVACCLREEEHWGTDNVETTQLCRSAQEIGFYSNSLGWDQET